MSAEDEDEGYRLCVERMFDAGARWSKAHPFAEPRILSDAEMSVHFARAAGVDPTKKIAVVARLSEVIEVLAQNEDARQMLAAMASASGDEGTYLQARAIFDTLREEQVKRASGQMPSGHWACTGCGMQLDGFTNVEGEQLTPNAGSFSLCMYCGALQRVNRTQTGFNPATASDLSQLKKADRKLMLDMRNKILAKKKKTS